MTCNFTPADRHYMQHALRLATKGVGWTRPNPCVGAVVVQDQQIVGTGWHARAGGPHAERIALDEAGARAQGATLYVTLEPCCHQGRTAPCTVAIARAGVARVVVAMQDPNPLVCGQGLQTLQVAGIEVTCGIMEAEARALNRGFVKRMRSGFPYVRCKMAMSLDGATAMRSGESKWITGAEARSDVQRLRAQSCAVITGINTILADDPALTLRVQGLQPARVILDSKLRLPPQARLLQQPGKTIILTGRPPTVATAFPTAEVISLPGDGGRIDLQAALRLLAAREYNEVLLEAGSVLAGALLEAHLIDELILYVAPVIMGVETKPLCDLSLAHFRERRRFHIQDTRACGEDWCIIAIPVNAQEKSDFC